QGAPRRSRYRVSLNVNFQVVELAAAQVLVDLGDAAAARVLLKGVATLDVNKTRAVPSLLSVRARSHLGTLMRRNCGPAAHGRVARLDLGADGAVADDLLTELEAVNAWQRRLLGPEHTETLATLVDLARAHVR